MTDRSERPSHTAVAELSAMLSSLLAAIDRGELEATAALRHRIEGGLVVLGALAGRSSERLLDDLTTETEEGPYNK